MRKFIIVLSALAATAMAAPIASSPASAQSIQLRVGDGGHRHQHWDRGRSKKKVVIIKRNRGHHYGWRNHRAESRRNVTIIRRD